jgi:hypothetical protein
MKTVAEYRSFAEECRKLAARRLEDKQSIESIAQAWDKIADELETQLSKK